MDRKSFKTKLKLTQQSVSVSSFRSFLLALLILTAIQTYADEPFRRHRFSALSVLPTDSTDIIMIGNSITDMFPWNEALGPNVKNRGISGALSHEILDHVDEWLQGHPAQILIMIGTNDIGSGISPDSIAQNVDSLIRKISQLSPRTQVILQSILPSTVGIRTLDAEMKTNHLLSLLANIYGHTFIDLWSLLRDIPEDRTISLDGLHLTAKGYQAWCSQIAPLIRQDCRLKNASPAPLQGNSDNMRATYFSSFEVSRDDILLLGDEMIKAGEWNELTGNSHLLNRGTGWGYEWHGSSIARCLSMAQACLFAPEGNDIVLYTGTGDINDEIPLSQIQESYLELLDFLRMRSQGHHIYLMSLMPTGSNNVEAFNSWLKELADGHNSLDYIDIYSLLRNNPSFLDGRYLNGKGYEAVAQLLKKSLSR